MSGVWSCTVQGSWVDLDQSLRAVEWSVTADDAATWTRPWTFAMNLTKKDASQRPFEYACHEGNYGLRNILSGARADERTAAQAAK